MAKRTVTVTMTVKQAAALTDAAITGQCDLEAMHVDDMGISEKWLKAVDQGNGLMMQALNEADPNWLKKEVDWREEE